jgi:hypothetical protein
MAIISALDLITASELVPATPIQLHFRMNETRMGWWKIRSPEED